jgi:hypothetical protein
MINIFITALFCATSLSIGWWLIDRCFSRIRLSPFEKLGFSIPIGCFFFYFTVFFIGFVELSSTSMWLLAAIASVLSFLIWRKIEWLVLISKSQSVLIDIRQDKFSLLLLAAIVCVGGTTILQGLAPPSNYDSLMYHLVGPKFDLEIGKFAVPWDREMPHFLFPSMMSNLTRFALATAGDGAAQMIHGVIGFMAAFGSYLVTRRLGFGRSTALGAALFFLVMRTAVWQMATTETDTPAATFFVFSILAYLIFRDQNKSQAAVLFGLMIGASILTKYHGFAFALSFALPIGFDIFRKRVGITTMSWGPIVALLTLVPHMVRNYAYTGNPIFPVFNSVFNPGKAVFFSETVKSYGTGRGLVDLLSAPFNIFVYPMHYFDGMIFGAPYLLVLAPLLLLKWRDAARWAVPASIVGVYYVLWFYLLSQQVRFLVPVIPIVAGMAAAGVATMWSHLHRRELRAAFAVIIAVLGINQMMFVGIYVVLRLPVVAGMVDIETYHSKTPAMTGDFYHTCSFLNKNLKPGEKYYSLIQPHSYYCPQKSAVHILFPPYLTSWLDTIERPIIPFQEFHEFMEKEKFKFIILPTALENRRNRTAKAVMRKVNPDAERFRGLLGYLLEAIDGLEPVSRSKFAAVYDGTTVLKNLNNRMPAANNGR